MQNFSAFPNYLRSRSKSNENNKYFKCKKKWHYLKNCPNSKEKEKQKTFNFGDATVAEEN